MLVTELCKLFSAVLGLVTFPSCFRLALDASPMVEAERTDEHLSFPNDSLFSVEPRGDEWGVLGMSCSVAEERASLLVQLACSLYGCRHKNTGEISFTSVVVIPIASYS